MTIAIPRDEIAFHPTSYSDTRSRLFIWNGDLYRGIVERSIAAFHDFNRPAWPGVTEAIAELGLQGEPRGFLFIWRKPAS